jgi:putative transposase
MQLVERHIINPNNSIFAEIDAAAFASKNLYNAANYIMRQAYIKSGIILDMTALYAEAKLLEAYCGLPRKVSNDVLRQLLRDWKSFREARKEYEIDPSKFLGRPKLPGYKHKTDGRNLLVYDIQAISKPLLKIKQVKLSGLSFIVQSKQTDVDQVRIVPKKTHYVIEVVYSAEVKPAILDYTLVAGVDLGLNNLAVIASNKPGFQPVVVNGRPIKSINQFYNKRKAELVSILMKKDDKRHASNRIERLTDLRTRRIDHYLHTTSKRIVDLLVKEQIGMLVIGKNVSWKQEIGIGKRNNQNFVSLPHARFIEMLTYKAQLIGINVVVTEESHTSKCSFLDSEPICHHEKYAGRRIARGMFRSANGRLINADLNGAYNIIRKVAPGAFAKGVEDVAVHPVALATN